MQLLRRRFSLKALLLAATVASIGLGWKLYWVRKRAELVQRVVDGRVEAAMIVFLDASDRWGYMLDGQGQDSFRVAGVYYTGSDYEVIQEPPRQIHRLSLWRHLWNDPAVAQIYVTWEADAEIYCEAFPEAEVLLPTPRLETLEPDPRSGKGLTI